MDRFEEGIIPNAQSFMNLAALKYVKVLANGSGSFRRSSLIIIEDIVSMIAAVSKKRTASRTSRKKIFTKLGEYEPNPNLLRLCLVSLATSKKQPLPILPLLKLATPKNGKEIPGIFATAPIITIV